MKLTKESKRELKKLNSEDLLNFAIRNHFKQDGQFCRAEETILRSFIKQASKIDNSDYDEFDLLNTLSHRLRLMCEKD